MCFDQQHPSPESFCFVSFLMPHFFLSFFLAEGGDEFDISAETPSPSQPAAEDPWWDMLLMARTQTILNSCSPVYSSKMSQFHRQQHREAAGLTFLRNPFLLVNTSCEIIIFYSFLWVVILHRDKQNPKQIKLKQVA